MKSSALFSRLITLEAKIDPILFRKLTPEEEDDIRASAESERGQANTKTVKGGLAALGVGLGGLAAHRAVQNAGGYQEVASKGLGKASDFLKDRKDSAMAGAAAGRKTGMNVAEKVGGLVDKTAAAAPVYANKAAAHVATGIQVAKTGALDVIKSLKKKLPMLVPHLAKIGLQGNFNGRLIELDEKLDAFLASRKKKPEGNAGKGALVGAGIGAGIGAAVGPSNARFTNSLLAGNPLSPGKIIPRERGTVRNIVAGLQKSNRVIARGGIKGRALGGASGLLAPGLIAGGAIVGHLIKKKNQAA